MSKEKTISLIKRGCIYAGNLLLVLLGAVSILICRSIAWMFDTWPNLSMDELMFQIRAPLNGTNQGMIWDYIGFCVPAAAGTFFILVILMIAVRRRKKFYHILIAADLAVSVILLAGGIYVMWNRLDIGNYAANNSTYSEFIDNHYVDPANTALTFPDDKRNLIYIYLESMEATYSSTENGGAFADDYIPELADLAQENEDFSGNETALNGGYSLTGATWTMGALFAQTTGLPLSIPIEENSMDTQESFLPGVTALGDILADQGYTQTFMIGSDAVFGGRSLYFTEHGNYDIEDYYYFRNLGKFPEDYRVWWGFEDAKLFEYAKEKLTELGSQSQPFNFTMLTVDTHFEDGYECQLCDGKYGDNTYANVISCSSRQVSEFVRWIQQQDFYENTTIVISGDHPTMDSDFCEDIDPDYNRKVYTAYINSAVEPADSQWRREYSTFDSLPTTLASLGVEIDGNRLGLGTNLFSDEMTLVELYGTDAISEELSKRSELLDELTSDIDEDSVALKVREGRAPIASAEIQITDPVSGAAQIAISDLENTETGIASVSAAIWTAEDQRDVLWVQATEQADGSYLAEFNLYEPGFVSESYNLDVYLTDDLGDQYCISSTTGAFWQQCGFPNGAG